MRVLLVTDFFPPVRGGLEGHVDNLATELTNLGHDVHVATLTERPTPTSDAVSVHTVRAAATRLLPHVDPQRPFHPPFADPLARRQLGDVIRAIAPDVVHAHSWLAASLPRQRAIPVVLTAHDYGLVCPKRTLMRPDDSRCAGPSLACPSCGREQYGLLKSAALSAATPYGRSRLHADAVIAVSTAVRDALQPRIDTEIEVIPNFIPSVESPSAVAGSSGLPTTRYAMFAGDPSRHKGLDVLLSAWEMRKHRDVVLVLAVTRPIERSLPGEVIVATLRKGDMSRAWAAADVAVVPSVWADPFPTVVLEAMAAGTPVVASFVGGIRDMFIDGEQGFHVAPNDPVALVSKLDSLLDDDALRGRMGEAARSHADRFRACAVVPRIVAVYERARVKVPC